MLTQSCSGFYFEMSMLSPVSNPFLCLYRSCVKYGPFRLQAALGFFSWSPPLLLFCGGAGGAKLSAFPPLALDKVCIACLELPLGPLLTYLSNSECIQEELIILSCFLLFQNGLNLPPWPFGKVVFTYGFLSNFLLLLINLSGNFTLICWGDKIF